LCLIGAGDAVGHHAHAQAGAHRDVLADARMFADAERRQLMRGRRRWADCVVGAGSDQHGAKQRKCPGYHRPSLWQESSAAALIGMARP
jgi:hypothetical protein